MAGKLPLGSFQSKSTALGRMDARVKLWGLLMLSIGTFLAHDVAGLVLAVAILVASSAAARVTPGQIARALKPAVIILVIALIANALILDGGGDIPLWGPVGLSSAGIRRAVVAILKIAIVVGLVAAVTATTSSRDVSQALVGALRPLGRLGLDTDAAALAVSLALRFVPEAIEGFGNLVDAQRARGASFSGGPIKRLKSYAVVLIPLTVSLFRCSDDLARAIRRRCYTGRGMTDLSTRLGWRGWVADVAVLVVAIALARV